MEKIVILEYLLKPEVAGKYVYMDEKDKPKKGDVIQLLLKTEGRIMLCLDATYSGVDVPNRFKNDTNLMLILNSKMPNPIDIGEDSVCSELRFGGIPHSCTIPFDAIWSVFNPDTSHGMMWPESMPSDVLQQHGLTPFSELTIPPPKKKKSKKKSKKPVSFKVIEGDASPESTAKKPAKKPKLTLVE
jgi:stringent starvation protein B